MVAFKQQTGFWLARHRPAISWQKDFFDHIIRSEESLETQVLYAVNNPVRAGMVQEWWQYPDTDGTMVDEMRVRIGRGGAGWSLRLPITQW